MQARPEFSRPFVIDRLGFGAVTETLRANPEERVRLAKRMGLVSLDGFAATVRLQRDLNTGFIHVSGRLEGDVVQTCILTLAAFPTHVEDSFETEFSSDAAEIGDEITLDMENEPPEPIIDGVIDLGELVSQYLSLALDPYPRAPGAALDPSWVETDRQATSPFAALKNLKARN